MNKPIKSKEAIMNFYCEYKLNQQQKLENSDLKEFCTLLKTKNRPEINQYKKDNDLTIGYHGYLNIYTQGTTKQYLTDFWAIIVLLGERGSEEDEEVDIFKEYFDYISSSNITSSCDNWGQYYDFRNSRKKQEFINLVINH